MDKKILKEVLKRLLYLNLSASLIFPSFLFIALKTNTFLFYGALTGTTIGGIFLYYLAIRDIKKLRNYAKKQKSYKGRKLNNYI